MPFVSFTVTGLDEAIGRLMGVSNPMANTKRNVLSEVSDFMVAEMKNNVHVITGNLKSSIRSQFLTENSVLVEAGAEYAVYENARRGGIQGPHDFADRAEQATRFRFSSIISSAYGQMFSSL